jgi:drug/metabolite transporter (DMT)-like permease
VYAIGFSYAYLSPDASTGALILFAAVQMTMIGAGMTRDEHPLATEWASWYGVGLAATSGLGYAIWYAALKDVRSSFAAIVQLMVPVITARCRCDVARRADDVAADGGVRCNSRRRGVGTRRGKK